MSTELRSPETVVSPAAAAGDGVAMSSAKRTQVASQHLRSIGRVLVSERVAAVLSPLLLLGLWEVLAGTNAIDARFFPPPSQIAGSFVALAESGALAEHTFVSVRRVLLGFLLGGVPAIFLGLAMGLYRPVRALVDPLVSATYPIPKSALLPLVLLIFGLGEMSKVVVVAIGAFYPVVINTAAGVMGIEKTYHEVGYTYGARRWQRFRTIALPGAMPMILTGVQLGLGMGLILIAIAEMIGAREGLGWLIWNSWQIFAVENMYVGLIVIAALGVVLTGVLKLVERRLLPWRQ